MPRPRISSAGWAGAAAGGLWIYLCFASGAFFPGAVGVGVLLLTGTLALRLAAVRQPLVGVGRLFAVAIAAMTAVAVWTLISSAWSHSPARAVLEFDRSVLYLLALVAGGLLISTPARLVVALRFAFGALVVLCACALTTRVAPDVWHTSPKIAADRLSYPLTYWNGLGLVAVLATLLGVHFASSAREPLAMRLLGAASVPITATTLFFTFSRGPMAAGLLALVVYVLAARPRSFGLAALTAGPAAAIALVVAYGADRLATFDPTGPRADAQGHRVALAVVLCALGAAAARAVLAPLDARLGRIRVSSRSRWALAISALAAIVVVALAVGLPARVSREYRGFVKGSNVGQTGDFRTRLGDPGNNGRLSHWRVALDGFRAAPLHGQGAGTYELEWAQRRDASNTVLDAHSLYMETLDELGVVGMLLLAIVLLAVVAACVRGLRGRNRALYGALLALAVAWLAHAAVDWDWEMPAVTWWFFVLGGGALASTRTSEVVRAPGAVGRLVGVAALVALAATPALAALSQTRIDSATRAFARGDCTATIDASLAATRWLSPRPEPYLLLGYCDMRLGLPTLAVDQMAAAASRDPRNWRYRYGLAVARARAGLDPRQAARAAARLNPLSDMAQAGVARFRGRSPAAWRRAGRTAPLPSPS